MTMADSTHRGKGSDRYLLNGVFQRRAGYSPGDCDQSKEGRCTHCTGGNMTEVSVQRTGRQHRRRRQ